MSKKERRRREREAGAANFKSGNYKKKKNKSTAIDYDKLEEKVSLASSTPSIRFVRIHNMVLQHRSTNHVLVIFHHR